MSDRPSLAEAERTLKELEKEILERVKAADESTDAPAMDSAVGRLTYIDAYQQHQMDLHARRQLSSQLAAIRAALERVKAGTYGTCARCGQAIPAERLEYLPETPYCAKCN